MIAEELRTAIQEAIWKRDIPQAELARRTGLSEAQISRFRRGERSLSFEAIDRLLDVLDLEVVVRRRRERKEG
jgi:transcriptional regulator with XRE-family HTH domain